MEIQIFSGIFQFSITSNLDRAIVREPLYLQNNHLICVNLVNVPSIGWGSGPLDRDPLSGGWALDWDSDNVAVRDRGVDPNFVTFLQAVSKLKTGAVRPQHIITRVRYAHAVVRRTVPDELEPLKVVVGKTCCHQKPLAATALRHS